MIVVASRFRVANGTAEQVRAAFVARPRLVEHVAGFLGLEAMTDDEDPSVFYLVTRWTDRASFERWYRSDAHDHSHAMIPKGLKLDPSFTRVRYLQPIEGAASR